MPAAFLSCFLVSTTIAPILKDYSERARSARARHRFGDSKRKARHERRRGELSRVARWLAFVSPLFQPRRGRNRAISHKRTGISANGNGRSKMLLSAEKEEQAATSTISSLDLRPARRESVSRIMGTPCRF
jgi:hypothetical protein